jgi:hypothetical protein
VTLNEKSPTKLPLGVWVNLFVDLSLLTLKTKFKVLDRITLCGEDLRIKKISSLRVSEVPKAIEYQPGIEKVTVFIRSELKDNN